MPATTFDKTPREIESPDCKTPLLDWWKDHYSRVYIVFNPFFRLPATEKTNRDNTISVSGRNYIKADWRNLQKIVSMNATDYMKQFAETVSWREVNQAACPHIPFRDFALSVWISSCCGRRDDVPANLQELIGEYCRSNALFLPTDDVLSPALEPQVGRFLAAAGLSEVDIYDEFRHNKETCSLEVLSRENPSLRLAEAITGRGIHCIHSKALGLVMDWEFDGVSGLIGLSDAAAKAVAPEDFFEGFYVDERTYSDWPNPVDFFDRGPLRD